MELTPKEKAKELVNRFWELDMFDDKGDLYWIGKEEAKQCALICLDEVINSGLGSRLIQFEYSNKNSTKLLSPIKYWQEVKKEIEEL